MLEYTPDKHLTGGLRLAAHKTDSTARPIQRGFRPSHVILSLGQQSAPPARPIVAAGDRVLRGQTVACAASAIGVDVHASTSGSVRAIEERAVPTATGVAAVPCIVIDADAAEQTVDFAAAAPWPTDVEQQLARIRAGGIVGLGGAMYPTAAKLSMQRVCRILVINGAECEPYISCDDMLMREAAAQIVAGSRILYELLGAEQCIIAIERDKPLAIDAIDEAGTAASWPALRVAELATIYPAGGERQLIDVLTGREVPADGYPGDIGYVCQNVGTAIAVHRLATLGEPLTARIVTMTGQGLAIPQNVEAPIGSPIAELVEFCGGYREDVQRLIHGGSMMGYALPTDELPLTKGSNCIIAATTEEIRTDYIEWPCIRCGDCASVCPVRLQPQDLLIAARSEDHAALDALGLDECIDCGCCDVVCPSHIPLTETFRRSKTAHATHQRQEQFSAESEQRHLRREARHRDAAEQEQRLQERLKQAVESPDVAKGAIEAAIERARERRTRSRSD
jgi:H+/Na+-translocating ferredoxin:NAD+ oxidoreductase subunit C